MSQMYVSLRSVQRICLEGQKGEGIHVVVNKKVNNGYVLKGRKGT
jgi:hypothetical protein